MSRQNFSPLNLTGDEGRGFKQFPPFFEGASGARDHSETMGWINLIHIPNYPGVALTYPARVYFFKFSPASTKSPSKVHRIFLAFFDKYSKNSPRKSKGSRNVIRAELRRLPIPTRNARPNLGVGARGSGSQPPNCV